MPSTPAEEPLKEFAVVQAKQDIELRAILKEASRQASRIILRQGNGIGGTIRIAQLGGMLDQINGRLETMWLDTGRVTTKYYALAEGAADRAAMSIYRVLAANMSEHQAESLLHAFTPTLERGLDLAHNRREIELSTRVYKNISLTQGAVDRTVKAGLVNQLSARELAKDVKRFIDPDVPGGASHSAMRLARTEINNAFHERQIKDADNPFVEGVKWRLSKSHPKPDGCDDLAKGGDNGDGVYEKGKEPRKIHPHCLCYLTYETVSEEDALALILKTVNAA